MCTVLHVETASSVYGGIRMAAHSLRARCWKTERSVEDR